MLYLITANFLQVQVAAGGRQIAPTFRSECCQGGVGALELLKMQRCSGGEGNCESELQDNSQKYECGGVIIVNEENKYWGSLLRFGSLVTSDSDSELSLRRTSA